MIIALALLLVVVQLAIPLKYGFVPLLIASLHLGNVEIFGQFTPCRLLIVVGLMKAVMSGSYSMHKRTPVDTAVLAFAVVALLVSMAPREDVPSPIRQNLGLILNVVGSYFYGRAFLSTPGALTRFATALAIIIIPLSVGMSIEQTTRKNMYASVGSKTAVAGMRGERVRAQGPFGHAILAGNAAAVCMPIMLVIWNRRRKLAIAGMSGAVLCTVASASSGPLMSAMAGIFALSLWPQRRRMKTIRTGLLLMLIAMHLYSNRGVWYLMDRIDLVGGSTGYHRAKLIDNGLADFKDWWLVGTDYTRDWMHSGVSWSTRHTDITNYYLHLGVIGGMGLVGSLIAMLVTSYKLIGKTIIRSPEYLDPKLEKRNRKRKVPPPKMVDTEWAIWCVGAAIFTHCISFLSISYFDQNYTLFYLALALVPGATRLRRPHPARQPARPPMRPHPSQLQPAHRRY